MNAKTGLARLTRVVFASISACGLAAACASGPAPAPESAIADEDEDRCDPRGWPRLDEAEHSRVLCNGRAAEDESAACVASVSAVVGWLNRVADEAPTRPACLQNLSGAFEPFGACLAFPTLPAGVRVARWHASAHEGRLTELRLTLQWDHPEMTTSFFGALRDGGCGTGAAWTTGS